MLKETASQGFTRESLQQSGFEGFHHLYERRQEQFGQIPEGPGVYIILRENREPVKFLTSDADLAERWVADAQVIFIGHWPGAPAGLFPTLPPRSRRPCARS